MGRLRGRKTDGHANRGNLMRLKSLLLAAAAALTLAGVGAGAAQAAGPLGDKLLVRARIVSVAPDDSATIRPIGGTTDISTAYVPELDLSWFFTPNVAVEAICCVTPHDVKAVRTALGTVDLGDVTLFPPTVTLQYHFNPDQAFKPYIGAGVNYTSFFNADLPAGSPLASIDYDESFGGALQAGFDYKLNDTWYFNVDLKKIFISTDVRIQAGPALGRAVVTADVDIDPWVFGIGFGRKF